MHDTFQTESKCGILIVEDELIIAKGIEKRLTALGYHVSGIVATGGDDVETAASTFPDLILMDIHLQGGMDGITAADKIRETVDIPIVYLTAYADSDSIQRAKGTGPYGYIVKPFNDDTLKATIEMALYKHGMERKLRQSEQWLTTILRSIGDGVVAMDQSGTVTFMNPVAEEMTGWSQLEAQGRSFNEVFALLDEETRQPCRLPLQCLPMGEMSLEPLNQKILVDRQGRERVISENNAPILDQENRIVGSVLVFRDISERRKMEKELLRTRQLESIGILAGGIAHDYNNLLTAILGNISLSKMYLADGDKAYQKLTEAENASLRARDLTSHLLTLSRGGAPAKKRVAMAGIIREAAESTIRHHRGINCHFAIAENLDPVELDEGQISRVIVNLIQHAEQAMPEGGLIEIACNNIRISEEDRLPIQAGPYIRITVKDYGEGMPAEWLGRIFDPYFTASEGGKGLGLPTVYSIVKNHQGYIEAKSQIGEGTTFTIYLPCVDKALGEPLGGQSPEEKTDADDSLRRILVMDDEESIREVVGEMLKYMGYDVSLARNGQEAVDLYSEAMAAAKPYHAIIMDLTVPGGMGGNEAMEIIRETHCCPK